MRANVLAWLLTLTTTTTMVIAAPAHPSPAATHWTKLSFQLHPSETYDASFLSAYQVQRRSEETHTTNGALAFIDDPERIEGTVILTPRHLTMPYLSSGFVQTSQSRTWESPRGVVLDVRNVILSPTSGTMGQLVGQGQARVFRLARWYHENSEGTLILLSSDPIIPLGA